MKHTISILTITAAMLCGTASIEAKTPVKGKAKAKTSTTQTVPMKTTAQGYADPGGHTYGCTMSEGSKMRFSFRTNGTVSLVCTISAKQKITGTGTWTQAGDYIIVYDEYNNPMLEGSISDDGKQILSESIYGETLDLRLVK